MSSNSLLLSKNFRNFRNFRIGEVLTVQYFLRYWLETVFQIILVIISFEWFFLCFWRSNFAENKSAGIHCSVPHKFFWRENSVLHKGCFKRLNAYPCRCLEVNTLAQVTKQADYLSWSLSSKFSTYRPDKCFCIIFILWKFGGKKFCLMAF